MMIDGIVAWALRAAALALALAAAAVHAQAPDKTYSTTGAGAAGAGQRGDGKAAAGAPARVLSTGDAYRNDPELRDVADRFSARFDGVPVVAVRRTPFGLFEVQIGMDLLYTDAQVSYVLDGRLIDAQSRRDLTRERQEAVSAVPLDSLPLHLAVKQVRGDGKRRLAIFEDPNCGYCKQLHRTLAQVDDVTIYTFLYPILSPDSHEKARDVWCADDPSAAWDAWMLQGKAPPRKQCSTPVDEVLALGQQLMVRGTPTLFFADGSRVSGAIPLDMLQARLR